MSFATPPPRIRSIFLGIPGASKSRIAVLRRCPTLVPHTREIILFSPRALVKAGFAPPPPRAPEFCPWRTQYIPNQVENLFPACLRSLRGAWSRASRSLRPEPAAACLATRREDRDEREGGPLAVAGAPRSRASSPKVPPNCVLCFVWVSPCWVELTSTAETRIIGLGQNASKEEAREGEEGGGHARA